MTFSLESLGCAKNQVESELWIAALEEGGLSYVGDPRAAEVLVVNTCGFIASAKEESIRTVLELRERFPGKRIVMAGCLVRRHEDELRREMPEIDAFTGALTLKELTEAVTGSRSGPTVRIRAGAERLLRERRRLLSFPGSAFVRIADGCSNRCSYCAIPLIRGELSSRTLEGIREEVRGLLERGVNEINLVAQDLASYGGDEGAPRLPRLLEALLRLPGRFWIRMLYLHPDHFPGELLKLASADSRLLPYFDLPFQHASRRILAAMNRKGDGETYLSLLRSIRDRIPGAVIRSTFLVGFPGETEKDFQELLRFQEEAQLDWAGVFAYSREQGTPAAGLKPVTGGRRARLRQRTLEEIQTGITERRLERFVGRDLELLVEERIEGRALALGRSYAQAPEVDGAVVLKSGRLVPGTLVEARIVRRNGLDLEASIHAG